MCDDHRISWDIIRYISSFAGGGLDPLWEPMHTSASIQMFTARHERLDMEIADGDVRATGMVGGAKKRRRFECSICRLATFLPNRLQTHRSRPHQDRHT